MDKILFIGASGMLGQPVARELIRAGFDLTLAGRDTEKLQKLFPGIPVVKGDVHDKDSLAAAIQNHQIVYANLSINQSAGKKDLQTEREGIQTLVETAREKNIQRLGYLSSLIKNYHGMNGFNWWAFDIKHRAVEEIKKSGIPYSVFYPSTFMETLDKQMLQGNRLMLAGKSESPMWFISGKDFGMQVAWAFKKAGPENQEYSVQGPEPFTFDEAAAIFRENYKKASLKIMKAPLMPFKLMGMVNQKLNYTANIIEALNKYPEKFESQKTWQELGKPTTTVAQYAAGL
jgi:uncharacterized protein YbjT (DUF2867 family)